MAFEDLHFDSGKISALSDHYLTDEAGLVAGLRSSTRLSTADRDKIGQQAARYVSNIRADLASIELIDAFLQEYGLSTDEGIALMRLSEALIRTPDFPTARLLVRDKLAPAQWSDHAGESEHFLVNRATGGLRLSSAWIKASGGVAAQNLAAKLGDRVLAAAIGRVMTIMGDHFVLGQSIEAASSRGVKARRAGVLHSYDMLGEAAFTADDAETYFNAYLHAVQHLANQANGRYASVAEAPGISVKLSALHPRYEYAQRHKCIPVLLERIRALSAVAMDAGLGLTIDAEEADRLEVSLLIFDALLQDDNLAGWDGLGIVVQAYQRRAVPVLRHLIGRANACNRSIAVRLVKGAYWDMEIKRAQELGLSSYPVFTRKENTDVSYLACARILLDAGDRTFPQFATHNAHTAATIAHMAGANRQFEFQRLHGMGEALHSSLMAQTGVRSRIYAPVGDHKDLLPYLVRRLLENGANSSFVNQLLDTEIAIDKIVSDPMTLAEKNTVTANPKIPAPRDLLQGERLSAYGVDVTQARTQAALKDALRTRLDYSAASVINGKTIQGEGVKAYSPTDMDRMIGTHHSASVEHVDHAVAVAKASNWSRVFTPSERASCLDMMADLLEEEMNALIELCVIEAGKTPLDAIAEVREAVDFCRYYACEAQKPRMTGRAPLGVVACISPWNFPLAIFLGQVVAALSAGNSVVAKPAEQTPFIAHYAVQLLLKAGVPSDAVQLFIGDGAVLGNRLTRHRDVDGVCFTGSTATAKRIALSLAQTGRGALPFIAETGGINAMIIDSTALLEQAVQDVTASAFQSAGQRCSACRLVAVQDDIADDFIEMLSGAMSELVVGDPARFETDVGPVIDRAALDMIQTYTEQMTHTHRVIGKTPIEDAGQDGFFTAPIAFEIDSISDLNREVFGPVLHVVRFAGEDLDETVDAINALGFGLTMGLHTRLDARVENVASRAHVGNFYVNRNQIGAVVGVQPFGGEGLSGTGPKAGGPHYLLRLSKTPAQEVESAAKSETISLEPTRDAGEDGFDLTASLTALSSWASKFSAPDRRRILQDAVVKPHQVDESFWSSLDVEPVLALPGPTGERNELRLCPRGIFVCFPANDLLIACQQVLQVLTAGNVVVIADTPSMEMSVTKLAEALVSHGAPEGLVRLATPSKAMAMMGADIAGIVADGPERGDLANLICNREGAILPLLSSRDDPERFYHERTMTINTTAAGGNASLLAMA